MAHDNWGEAARIGIFIVGNEVVPEAEWWAMAPNGVSIHAARVTAPAPWAVWAADRKTVDLVPDLARGAEQFAGMALSAVVVAHSSSSVVGGPGWDSAAIAALAPRLPRETAVTTNGRDCLAALGALGIRRPLVVFPPWFGAAAMDAGAAYLTRQGIDPEATFRLDPGPRWAGIAPGDLYGAQMHVAQDVNDYREQIIAKCPMKADGVLIYGTGVRAVGIIGALEAALDRPVVTANQASLWRCLGLARTAADIPGYGRLFGCPPPPA